MNRHPVPSLLAGLAAFLLAIAPGRADGSQLSPERLNTLDQMGYFTPGFKAAVHDLIDSKRALESANAEKQKLALELPADIEAKTAALRQELAKYDHPEEADFAALQNQMTVPDAKPDEEIAMAQAYVWTYPASPHASDAQQILQRLRKNQADQQQAEKDAEAARAAAHAKLVQRAQARDLSLGEWRDFLRDMSQDDLVKFLGRPTSQSGDYWIYDGAWILDPATKERVGMEMNFNGGRVLSVVEKPSPP